MLKMISHTDRAAKKMVEKFCHRVVWLLNVRRIFAELFEDEQSRVLMEKTASSFFADLNRMVHFYLLGEFAKITDPAKTGHNENLTIDNLIESIEWPPDVREELISLRDKTKPFGSRILPARHKLFAHTDKKTVLTDRTLGEFPEGEDEVFPGTLLRVCDVTYKACFGEAFGQISLAVPGDVLDFKGAVGKAVAFDEFLSGSSGPEKARLYSCLQKVRHRSISVKGEARKEGSL